MKIVLGITGSISAYKAPDVISGLIATGHTVRVVMTESAKQFITEMTVATISKNPVIHDLWNEKSGVVNHIEMAGWADMLVIAPCTLNTMSKIANGIADNELTCIASAFHGIKKMIVPAMNTHMLKSKPNKRNSALLISDGWVIHPTDYGMLACGDEGYGKFPKPRKIVESINQVGSMNAEWFETLSEEYMKQLGM